MCYGEAWEREGSFDLCQWLSESYRSLISLNASAEMGSLETKRARACTYDLWQSSSKDQTGVLRWTHHQQIPGAKPQKRCCEWRQSAKKEPEHRRPQWCWKNERPITISIADRWCLVSPKSPTYKLKIEISDLFYLPNNTSLLSHVTYKL